MTYRPAILPLAPVACAFPVCDKAATTRNRAEQPTCDRHRVVVVSGVGSWLDDRHGALSHG